MYAGFCVFGGRIQENIQKNLTFIIKYCIVNNQAKGLFVP